MSSPAKAKADTILGVTMNDVKILLLGILSAPEPLKPDFEKFSKIGSYTTASAHVVFRKALKKLLESNPNAASAGTAGTASAEGTPVKTPVKRRSSIAAAKENEKPGETVEGAADAADADGDAEDNGGAEGAVEPEAETPKKRQKRTPKKGIARKVVKKDKVASDDEDAECPTTPVKANTKARGKPRGRAATVKKESSPAKEEFSPVKQESPPIKEEDSTMQLNSEVAGLHLPTDASVEMEIENMDVTPANAEVAAPGEA